MERDLEEAVQDTIGVKTYFGIINLLICGRRINATIVTGNNKKDLKKVANYLKSGISDGFIKKQFNTEDKQNIIVSKGEFIFRFFITI